MCFFDCTVYAIKNDPALLCAIYCKVTLQGSFSSVPLFTKLKIMISQLYTVVIKTHATENNLYFCTNDIIFPLYFQYLSGW